MQVNSSMRTVNGELTTTRCFGVRITPQYQLKEISEMLNYQVERVQQLEKAKENLQNFADHICHELRNTLQNVKGHLDLLDQDFVTIQKNLSMLSDIEPKEQCKELIHMVKQCSTYLNSIRQTTTLQDELVNGALDTSRLEAKELVLVVQPFSFREAVETVVQMRMLEVNQKGLRLDLCFSPSASDIWFVKGDRTRVQQIILNLLGNAIKFTRKGTVSIHVKGELVEARGAVAIQLQIRDEGIGMSRTQINRLFKRFSQADPSIYQDYGGSGLGLSIVQRLVHLMEGTIKVESEMGKGSTFFVELEFGLCSDGEIKSLKREPHEVVAPGYSVSFGTWQPKVMIVEDGPCDDLHNFFQVRGCPSVSYSNIFTAFDELRNSASSHQPFEVLLLNIDLIKDMKEFVSQIRFIEKKEQQQCYIIVGMSCDISLRESVLSCGFDAFFPKPIDFNDLWLILCAVSGVNKKPSTKHKSRHCSKYKILIVDDNRLNRKVLMATLERVGYNVMEVSDGEKALRMVCYFDFHCIIMDAMMPNMNGFEAAKLIREKENKINLKRVPIVCLSGLDKKSKKLSMEAGMDEFLVKPYESQHLLALVAKHLGIESPTPSPQTPRIALPAPYTRAKSSISVSPEPKKTPKIEKKSSKSLLQLFKIIALSVILSFLWNWLDLI
uniref:Histidine kinase n=1 Tax=Arcella intermedia TaxID=1963864 RepID=A0A6B2KYZ0_9EUKA